MKYISLFLVVSIVIFFSSCSGSSKLMKKDALECRVKGYRSFVALSAGDTISGEKVNLDFKKAKVNINGVGYDFDRISTYQTKRALFYLSGKQEMSFLKNGQISVFSFLYSEFRQVGQYPNSKTDVRSSNEIRLRKNGQFYFASQGDLNRLIADKPKAVAEFKKVFRRIRPDQIIMSYKKIRRIVTVYNES